MSKKTPKKVAPDQAEAEAIRVAFVHFDTDGDGKLSPSEFREALQAGAEGGADGLAHEQFRLMMDIDRDNDGQIDLDEFVIWLQGENNASESCLVRKKLR